MTGHAKAVRVVSAAPLDDALRSILAQPQKLLWTAVLSAVVAFGCALALGAKKYTCEGKLLHVPNSITAPYYESPALGSLVQLVVSPKLIDGVRDEFSLPEDVATLRHAIGFDIAQADTLTVTIARAKQAEAERILNGVMKRIVDEAGNLRNAALSRFVTDFSNDAASARAKYDQAQQRQQQFLAEHDLKTPGELMLDGAGLQQAATELELMLESARSELSAASVKRNHLRVAAERESKRLVDSAVVAAGGPSAGEAADAALISAGPTLQRDFERRGLLRDKIEQQQELASYATRIKVKKNELDRARALRERGLISVAEVEKHEGELAVLEAEQTESVQHLYDNLALVENRISDAINGNASLMQASLTSPTHFLDDGLSPARTLAILDLEILGIEERVSHMTKMLEVKRKQLANLGSLQKEFAPYAEDVRLASDEWERLKQLLDEFKQATQSAAQELTVVQPAALAFGGVRTNKSRIFAMVFAGVFVLATAPRVAGEWRKNASGGA